MSPLRLSDSELDAVMRAAQALDVRDRDGFLQEVAREASCGEIGPGVVHRVCAENGAIFDPPQLHAGALGKYR